ncbi:MAG: response regulator [Gammaproteobacteria bacterium]
MSDPRTVFIVDDDASVRDSLALLLGLKGLRTQMFANAETFLSAYRANWHGCILMDVRMPGMSGLDLQKELSRRGSTLPVVIMTAHGDVATARDALKAGAADFLEKPLDDEVLVEVLLAAMSNHARPRRKARAEPDIGPRLDRLTARERQVMEFLARGMQNVEIAATLGISPRTVEVYKARMFEKLGVRSVAEVVRLTLGAPPVKEP